VAVDVAVAVGGGMKMPVALPIKNTDERSNNDTMTTIMGFIFGFMLSPVINLLC